MVMMAEESSTLTVRTFWFYTSWAEVWPTLRSVERPGSRELPAKPPMHVGYSLQALHCGALVLPASAPSLRPHGQVLLYLLATVLGDKAGGGGVNTWALLEHSGEMMPLQSWQHG